jgi:hypothetical protein
MNTHAWLLFRYNKDDDTWALLEAELSNKKYEFGATDMVRKFKPAL